MTAVLRPEKLKSRVFAETRATGKLMHIFVFICLSVLLVAFLLMLSIQLIRMEKTLTEISELTEAMVKKFYGNV